MSIYDHDSYKVFVNKWIQSRPRKGRGQLRAISEHLKIHTTMASHIFRGDSHLNLEQASELCLYIGLNPRESDFFLDLVSLERAGSLRLKNLLSDRISKKREEANQIKNRMPNEQKELSELDKAIFYSAWYYSAIRLKTTMEAKDSEELREELGLEKETFNQAMDFLLKSGICQRDSEGKVSATPSMTHLPSDSVHLTKHHQGWRLRSMDKLQNKNDEDLFYTAPLTIAQKDMNKFRSEILKLIESLKTTVEKTDPDSMACLNIDWFRV